jgi:hypothetical protein
MVVEVRAHALAENTWQVFRIPAQSAGFYFDLSAGYLGYSGGLTAARQDAMVRAVRKTLDLAAKEFSTQLRRTTRVVKLEGILPATEETPEYALLATGPRSNLPPGVVFFEPKTGYRVAVSAVPSTSGSVATVLSEVMERPSIGALLYEEVPSQIPRAEDAMTPTLHPPTSFSAERLATGLQDLENEEERTRTEAPRLLAQERVDLPSFNFARAGISEESDISLFFKSLAGAVLLPYRIYRWWQYDQSYHKKPDSVLAGKHELRSLRAWVDFSRQSYWAKQIGLDRLPRTPTEVVRNPFVAIIDTGMDYNHPVLHGALAVAEAAPADRWGQKARIGWDYISGDSKPFDENDHGTELASLVLAVAPHAKILPLKAFNAWGSTSSQAIYSSFLHAIRAQVDIILFGSSTLRFSRTLKAAIAAANEAGIPVLAPAGDEGLNLDYLQQRSYPASWGREFPFFLGVAATDRRGMRLGEGISDTRRVRSNFASEGGLLLAAPGDSLAVVRPRTRRGSEEGTAYAAALVTGALARELSLAPWPQTEASKKQQARESLEALLSSARRTDALKSVVEEGRSLWLRN